MYCPRILSRLVSWFLLAWLPASSALGATLIPTGSDWSFLRGTNAPSPADPVAWRRVGFNDASWEKGIAPFSYGEAGFTGTQLTDMQNRYSTVFLRRRFQVANPKGIQSLDLNTICDDGFVAYLNGTRVAALNFGETDPVSDSLATSAQEYVQTSQTLVDAPSLLVPGENVLAVVVLNGSLSSSDLVFDAELVSTEVTSMLPRVVAVTPAPGLVTNLTEVVVTFSEPVSGVAAGDFLVNGVPATSVSGTGTTYRFLFPQPGPGGVVMSWGTLHAIQDLDVPPNRFDGGAPGSVWAYEVLDPAGPAVGRLRPVAGVVVRQLGEVEVTFTRSVLGVEASDLRCNGIGALSVTGLGPGPYRFQFPEVPDGPAVFSWRPGHGIVSDEPEPHPFRGGDWQVAVDSKRAVPQVVIHELLADNANGLRDEDGDAEDWIELHNRGVEAVSLKGWSLGSGSTGSDAWLFPEVEIPGGGFLVVFASGKDRRPTTPGVPLHLDSKLNATGDTWRLFGPEWPAPILSGVQYPEQGPDYSYGVQKVGNSDAWRYFRVPTPGSSNGISTVTGRAEAVHFSVQRGFFDRPFVLTLATPTPGATIRFTTNGSAPTPATGFVYGAPLTLTSSRVIRAAAFAPHLVPSQVGTHTYLFNIPANRRLLPALSLVTATNHLYGSSGIMESSPRNTTKHGPAWERPVSVELIRPEDHGGFQIDAGIRVAGGDYIRERYNYRQSTPPEGKYSYRLYFRGEYGPGELDYPMFPGTTVSSFNSLHLRAGMNDPSNPFLKDEFVRALTDDVGITACHGTFVNLFLNGVYKGIYNPTERVDDDFLQRYHGGGGDWDVIGAMSAVVRGDAVAWNQLKAAALKDLTVRANYEAIAARMDLENFVDYLLPLLWADNDDWPHNNTRAARERVPGSPFRFYPWDAEFSFGFSGHSVSYDTLALTLSNTSPPWGNADYQKIFNALRKAPEFKLLFADRVHRAFFNGGPLTDEQIRWRYEGMRARVAPSITGFNNAVGTWINSRRRWTTNMFQKAGFLLSSNAPVLSRHGGLVSSGFVLSMSNQLGPIHYTTDGSDPRVAFDGIPSPSSRVYGEPLVLTRNVRIRARSLNGTQWSALTDAEFRVAQAPPVLVVSEIHYHPVDEDRFEFLELLNPGTVPVDLSDCVFTGIGFRFPMPGPVLAPGARLVLASDDNPAAFQQRHPRVEVAGWFSGSLDNGGETIRLLDRDGAVMVSVTYGDAAPWPTRPDGRGGSLELLDPMADPGDPANWQASVPADGTPGVANSVPGLPPIRLSEILSTAPPEPEWVELRNPGAMAMSLAGWSLSDSANPRRWVFPPGVSIPAGGYLQVFCGDGAPAGSLATGFGLDRDGGTLALYDPTTNRIHAATFGPAVAQHSLGWVDGVWTLCDPTPGGPNERSVLGSVSSLRLNEVVADGAGEGEWLEVHNTGLEPVALRGCRLTTSNAWFRLRTPIHVGGGGFVVLKADRGSGPDRLGLRLAATGDRLALLGPDGDEVDQVTWSRAVPGVPRGRLPDGIGEWLELPSSASPGTSNYLASVGSGLRFHEILAGSLKGPSDWFEVYNPTDIPISLAGHSISVGKPEPGEWSFPATAIVPPLGVLVVAASNPPIPGSLNLGRDLRDEGTLLCLFDPKGRLLDRVLFGPQLPDRSVGRVESTWVLLAQPTPGVVQASAAAMGDSSRTRINEWLASGGGVGDWLELYNPEPLPVDLGGWVLSDDPSMLGYLRPPLPPLTLIPGAGYRVLRAEGDPAAGPDHLGFQLNAWGETLRLYNPQRTTIDSVAFGAQMEGVSEGRYQDGGALVLAFPGVASPGESNRLPPNDRDGDGLPDGWELLHGLDPSSGSDRDGDPDRDGQDNLAEFQTGTDPRDPSSVFRLDSQVGADGKVHLRFRGVAGRSYRVLRAEVRLDSGWSPISEVLIPATDGVLELTDNEPGTGSGSVRFYRLQTPAAP